MGKSLKTMLFLVNCTVKRTYYQSKTTTIERNHIVEAESLTEASDKVYSYYEGKNDPYFVTYYVDVNYVNPIII